MKEIFFIQPADSLSEISNPAPVQIQRDTNHRQRNVSRAHVDTQPASAQTLRTSTITTNQTNHNILKGEITDTISLQDTLPKEKIIEKPEFINFTFFKTYAGKDSSVISIPTNRLSTALQKETSQYTGAKDIFLGESGYKSWILLLVLLCTFVLIIIRISFQKYLESVLNSLLNYRLAEKLMREKNVLIRRAFLLLNFNYYVCCGLFFYLIVFRNNISFLGLSEFGKFFILLFVFFILLQLRLLIMQLIAKIFDSRVIFKEYIHISYLLNKNLGIYLLPVVFSAFFILPIFSDVLYYIALVMIAISLIIKYIRSTQIILKHKVFLFYSILYLCTFEILPILVGLKLVLSLR